LTAGCCTHQAAELLNTYVIDQLPEDQKKRLHQYTDQKRTRRMIPHQTDVDQFFRRLTEQDVKILFGGLLDYIVQKIVQEQTPNRSWLSIVDNTKYAYYGKINPVKHIGSNHLPGTKVAWMIQGISFHSSDIHLYTDFHTLSKGVYRALHVPDSIAWQQWLVPGVEHMVFDREFYRAALVAELHQLEVKCLFPTKKYEWVKHHMEWYLLGQGDFVVGNIFAQSSTQYPFQAAAFVRLVIIGKDNQSAWEIKQQYDHGQLSFKQALRELRGFFTNYKPWKNKKAWARYLTREYKRRWNTETGFCVLNRLHESCRTRYPAVKLANVYCRGILYDWWQSWRLNRIRSLIHHRDYTLTEFKWYVQQQISVFLRVSII